MFSNAIFILFFASSAISYCHATNAKNYTARDVQPVGCNQTTTQWTTTSRSKLSCAASCATNTTCAAFLYSFDGTCSLCRSDLVQALGFIRGLAIFWPQQYREKWPLTDVVNKYTNRSLVGTVTVTTGSVVHLHGMFYNLSGFLLDLRQDVSGNNVSFHFRSRHENNTGLPLLILSSRKNKVWREVRVNLSPYPFVENTTTTVDVLVREDSYQVYIDQRFCCYYNHTMSYQDIKFIYVIGNIEVYELGV